MGMEPRSGTASPTRNLAAETAWNPLDFFFSSTLLGSKCDICMKRLGWKPVLECDDCGLRYGHYSRSFLAPLTNVSCSAHIKCGEVAPMDCGLRPQRTGAYHDARDRSASPLSKVKARKSLSTPTK